MHRVQKLICNYGYCSRRKAEELIEHGRVKVNGKKIILGDKAEETDRITVDGKVIKPERKTYLIFNKPIGCVTALTDKRYKTIMDYIRIKERVFPIGRLDFNTSGLLILTNDGDFANNVMHPRYEIKKSYVVQTDRPLSSNDQKKLEQGVSLDDGRTSPAKVTIHDGGIIRITIHEGKNRIVRRMLMTLGYKVRYLNRIRIGKLDLGNLKPGRYRFLKKKEMDSIFKR